MTDPAALRARLADVRDRIARAAGRAGRDPASVRLVAISKTFSADHVRAAADCGQIDFGENKVQEALEKMDQTADLPLRWHLVGHLQSNKARKAGARFDVVHSVDEAAVAARLDEGARGRRTPARAAGPGRSGGRADQARRPGRRAARASSTRRPASAPPGSSG